MKRWKLLGLTPATAAAFSACTDEQPEPEAAGGLGGGPVVEEPEAEVEGGPVIGRVGVPGGGTLEPGTGTFELEALDNNRNGVLDPDEGLGDSDANGIPDRDEMRTPLP